MGLSLRPSTFSAGGSLIDDVDAEIVRARFVQYDFEGKSESGAKLCLLAVLKDGDGAEHPQYWSAGDLRFFVPSEDPKNDDLNGITVVQVGDKTALNGGTNCALFLNSLVQAGFPEDKLDEGDIRVLEGMVCHVNRVPQPKRNNMPKRAGAPDRDPMILIVTAIKSLPGEKKAAAKTNGAAKPTATSAKPSSTNTAANAKATNGSGSGVDAEMVAELEGELIGLFADKGVTSLKKVELTKGLFATIDKANPNRSKLMSAAAKDEYLKALEAFSFDGSVLSQNEN